MTVLLIYRSTVIEMGGTSLSALTNLDESRSLPSAFLDIHQLGRMQSSHKESSNLKYQYHYRTSVPGNSIIISGASNTVISRKHYRTLRKRAVFDMPVQFNPSESEGLRRQRNTNVVWILVTVVCVGSGRCNSTF
jgi:hypothetical protein